MIQRVQSVYLLLVTVLMSFMLMRPYAEVTLADGRNLTFHSYMIENNTVVNSPTVYKTTIPVIALVLLTGLLSFANIFLFNHRIVQLRICLINVLLLVCLLIVMYIYYSSTQHSAKVSVHAFRFPAIYPLLTIISSFLAYRNIYSDEMLVKSNRIR